MEISEKIENLALIMAFVICAETFLTGVHFTTRLDEDVVISSYDSYHDFYDRHMDAVDYVKDTTDEEFYRFEKTFTRNVTDYFVFDINGLYFRKDYLIDIVKYHHFWHFRYWQKL